jgi:hypothetical protein
MVKALSSCRSDDIMDINDGYPLLKDGDSWVAVGPDFIDLQRSPAGFGATKEEAVRALQRELRKAGYPDHAIPRFREFQVMPTADITPLREEIPAGMARRCPGLS